MELLLRGFLIAFLAPFALVATCIWRPARNKSIGKPVADRIAWTGFALGICLTLNMAVYATASESDGDIRTWETIIRHRRIFFAFGLLAVSGPLVVLLRQAVAKHLIGASFKKPYYDDLWI